MNKKTAKNEEAFLAWNTSNRTPYGQFDYVWLSLIQHSTSNQALKLHWSTWTTSVTRNWRLSSTNCALLKVRVGFCWETRWILSLNSFEMRSLMRLFQVSPVCQFRLYQAQTKKIDQTKLESQATGDHTLNLQTRYHWIQQVLVSIFGTSMRPVPNLRNKGGSFQRFYLGQNHQVSPVHGGGISMNFTFYAG